MGRNLRKTIIARNANDAGSVEHNLPAGSKKVINNLGFLRYLGTGGAALSAPFPGGFITVYNNASTVGFIAFGLDTTLTAPAAAGANIIPCKPNDWTTICIGYQETPGTFTDGIPNAAVRGSAATLLIYALVDDTELFLDPNS